MLFNLFRKPTLKAYWWADQSNFGDALAPFLLARFADAEKIEYAPVEDANVVSIGSVLEHIPEGWRGHILGSGRLKENSSLKFDPKKAKILALRGPLSAKGIPGSYALGDPGLLANELIDSQEKYWDLGILPHWRDQKLVKRFLSMIPKKFTVRVIRPEKHPLQVIREIAACRRLVTSSLHGVVVADAIGGIPRRIEYCDKLEKEGRMFKFNDYSESIQCPFEIGKMTEAKRNKVNDVKHGIWDAYRELSKTYGKN